MAPERFAKLKEILNRRQPNLTVLMDEIHKPQNIADLLPGILADDMVHSIKETLPELN